MAQVRLQGLLYRVWRRMGPFTLNDVREELAVPGLTCEDTEIYAELRRLGYVYNEGSYSAPQAELEARIVALEEHIDALDALAAEGVVLAAIALDEDEEAPDPRAQAIRDRLTRARTTRP